MALINNLYVQAIKEDWNKSVESTSHPVEKGFEVTDSVRKKPKTLSLSGNIVDAGGMKAEAICAKLHEMENAGSLIKFVGRKNASNMQIQSFNESYSNEIWGGFAFSMELKEVRIAKIAYVEPQASSANVSSTGKIKVGDIVVFKGGNVYVSSDAKKPATTKGRQTCKVTKINDKSWGLHDYHLISTEKKYPYNVYGWCDIEDIEGGTSQGVEATATKAALLKNKTKSVTKSGMQQVSLSDGTSGGDSVKYPYTVFHTVKQGDTLYSIYSAYKDLRTSKKSSSDYITMRWLSETNKNSIRVTEQTAGGKTFTSYWLTVGSKLLVGYRKDAKYSSTKDKYATTLQG